MYSTILEISLASYEDTSSPVILCRPPHPLTYAYLRRVVGRTN
jgi:hypothetical protein